MLLNEVRILVLIIDRPFKDKPYPVTWIFALLIFYLGPAADVFVQPFQQKQKAKIHSPAAQRILCRSEMFLS